MKNGKVSRTKTKPKVRGDKFTPPEDSPLFLAIKNLKKKPKKKQQ